MPKIILIAPQMGENIGAAARAMKNFGLSELRIVNPRDGWPNKKANSVAVDAVSIIENAKIYADLPSAISDLEYIYATSANPRYLNKEYLSSKNIKQDYQKALKTGFLFGRESSGLTNEELIYANKIITINTSSEFSSMNIAQAVSIVCYELFLELDLGKNHQNEQNLATKGEVNYFINLLTGELEKRNFFKVNEKKPRMIKNIANIFTRIDKLSKSEIQTLIGIVNNLTRL